LRRLHCRLLFIPSLDDSGGSLRTDGLCCGMMKREGGRGGVTVRSCSFLWCIIPLFCSLLFLVLFGDKLLPSLRTLAGGACAVLLDVCCCNFAAIISLCGFSAGSVVFAALPFTLISIYLCLR
jgi:hypothetical protein